MKSAGRKRLDSATDPQPRVSEARRLSLMPFVHGLLDTTRRVPSASGDAP